MDSLKKIRKKLAEQTAVEIKDGNNPIRAHVKAWTEYCKLCEEKGLKKMGINLSIGNIDAATFDKETGFESLSDELGIKPDGKIYEKLTDFKKKLDLKYYKNSPLARYGSYAGILEVREALAEYLSFWGGISIDADNIFFSSGGASESARRVIKAMAFYHKANKTSSNFLTSVPSYKPIINLAIAESGMKVKTVECQEKDNYFFTKDNIGKLVKENKIGVVYIVPIGNPTSTLIEAKQLKETIEKAYRINPNIIFLVDLAYISTIKRKTAQQMMSGFKKVLNRCVFLTSLSKSHARPGDRLAGCYTNIDGMETYIKKATEMGNLSESRPAMLEAIAVLKNVNNKAVVKLAKLFELRRKAMIKVMKRINKEMGKEIFIGLDELKSDGGLYVYPRLKNIDSLELFIETGILGIGGRFFGENKNSDRVRFAIGTYTIKEIENIKI